MPLTEAGRAGLVIGKNAYQNATPLQNAAPDDQSVWENLPGLPGLGFAVGEKPLLNATLETTAEMLNYWLKAGVPC